VRGYDLVVFDWDGTLVDSISSIVGCTQRALADVGAPKVADSAIRRTIGLGIREMVDSLVPGCDDALFERICVAYREHWFSTFGARHQPFPGVGKLLTGLAKDGYLLSVATAKSRRGLAEDFERTGLGAHFHASRTVDESPAKPHPGMLESLIEEFGVRRQRTVMIGDTAHDLEMAVNAGTAGIGVLGGSHGAEQLEAVAHQAILANACELADWLSGW